MQTRYMWFTLLCSLPSFLGAALNDQPQCRPDEYAWPLMSPTLCCKMCEPGKFMSGRPDDTCGTRCEVCSGELYSDSYNIDMKCKRCSECNNQTSEYKSHCNGTHDAVCRCKAGYMCKNITHCTECVPFTTTTTTTTDTVCFLLVAALCSVIALFVMAKLKPFLQWIRSRRVLQYPEEDGVSKPVQEVCEKCDQPIDL